MNFRLKGSDHSREVRDRKELFVGNGVVSSACLGEEGGNRLPPLNQNLQS